MQKLANDLMFILFTRCADTDPNLIHKRDMEAAAVKAKHDYLKMHPEAATIELKTDVNDMIKSCKHFIYLQK